MKRGKTRFTRKEDNSASCHVRKKIVSSQGGNTGCILKHLYIPHWLQGREGGKS